MKKNQLLSLVCAALFFMGCGEKPAGVVDLTVELQENPIGLDEQHPRFGWRIESDQDDVMQTSYRIMVAPTKTDLDKAENLVWDSGVVSSDQSTFVPYAGSQLESRKDYYWKVLITTNKGDSLWSDAAQWSMALLDDGDWQAQWIGDRQFAERDGSPDRRQPSGRPLPAQGIPGGRERRFGAFIH